MITKLEREQEKQQQEQEHPKEDSDSLAQVWRDIHGENDWAGLLDPMDPILRSELIRYGEMAQACYDAFDYDPFSKYCGSCRFNRRNMFNSLGITHIGYDVTRHVYATALINFPNFFNAFSSLMTSNGTCRETNGIQNSSLVAE